VYEYPTKIERGNFILAFDWCVYSGWE
jgi:hypothetical protein